MKIKIWDKARKKFAKQIVTFKFDRDGNIILVVYLDRSNKTREITIQEKIYTNEFEIVQFVDLKDKNGKDICVGDIMSSGECIWDNNGKSAIMEVVYNPPRYDCRILNKSELNGFYVPFFTELQHSIYEIIGNKFENDEI